MACVHNLMLGAFTAVGGGTDMTVNGVNQPRYTPYHIRHRTEVAGFMTILHGDNRIYNNIFVQNWPVTQTEVKQDMGFMMADNQTVGTGVFDEYPTYEDWIAHFDLDKPADMRKLTEYHFAHLPVWIDGNAYFNGAVSWKKEEHALIDGEHPVRVQLEKRDGGYFLNTNLYEFMGDFRDGVITSDGLGYAFEPEQRFEDPDGTAISFDRDYAGNHRGPAPLPGPFASADAAGKNLI